MQYCCAQLSNMPRAERLLAFSEWHKSLFNMYFGFLGDRMGPRRRHQEVLSKQREDGGNFEPPVLLLDSNLSFKMPESHWIEEREWFCLVGGHSAKRIYPVFAKAQISS